jgi:hypothetical protein
MRSIANGPSGGPTPPRQLSPEAQAALLAVRDATLETARKEIAEAIAELAEAFGEEIAELKKSFARERSTLTRAFEASVKSIPSPTLHLSVPKDSINVHLPKRKITSQKTFEYDAGTNRPGGVKEVSVEEDAE